MSSGVPTGARRLRPSRSHVEGGGQDVLAVDDRPDLDRAPALSRIRCDDAEGKVIDFGRHATMVAAPPVACHVNSCGFFLPTALVRALSPVQPEGWAAPA